MVNGGHILDRKPCQFISQTAQICSGSWVCGGGRLTNLLTLRRKRDFFVVPFGSLTAAPADNCKQKRSINLTTSTYRLLKNFSHFDSIIMAKQNTLVQAEPVYIPVFTPYHCVCVAWPPHKQLTASQPLFATAPARLHTPGQSKQLRTPWLPKTK